MGSGAALGRGQLAALGGDGAALHAVGCVDLDVDHVTRLVLFDLVDLGRAHGLPHDRELARHVRLYADVVWLVVAGLVATGEDTGELVEEVLAVGFGVFLGPVANEDLALASALWGTCLGNLPIVPVAMPPTIAP